jgi:hypothetical protein
VDFQSCHAKIWIIMDAPEGGCQASPQHARQVPSFARKERLAQTESAVVGLVILKNLREWACREL